MLPRELFTKMGELGLTGVIFPEEYGGAGMGCKSKQATLLLQGN